MEQISFMFNILCSWSYSVCLCWRRYIVHIIYKFLADKSIRSPACVMFMYYKLVESVQCKRALKYANVLLKHSVQRSFVRFCVMLSLYVPYGITQMSFVIVIYVFLLHVVLHTHCYHIYMWFLLSICAWVLYVCFAWQPTSFCRETAFTVFFII